MNAIPMIAHRVVHVLNKITTKRDIDDLVATADSQQRQAIGKSNARYGNVEGVLFLVDPILGRMWLFARPAGRDVTTAR